MDRPAPASYWTMPRWQAVGSEVHVPGLIRFVDGRVPSDASLALSITPSDPGFVLLGPRLDRRFELLDSGAGDAPDATWAFVSPSARASLAPELCGAWRPLDESPSDWSVYRRAERC